MRRPAPQLSAPTTPRQRPRQRRFRPWHTTLTGVEQRCRDELAIIAERRGPALNR